MFLLGYLFDFIQINILHKCGKNVVMIVTNKKNWQLLDIVECVETCKQGLVLLVGDLTDEPRASGRALVSRLFQKWPSFMLIDISQTALITVCCCVRQCSIG